MNTEPTGWIVCDRNICIYQEHASPGKRPLLRCIKHGAILNYRSRLTGARTREEARARLNALLGRAA